MNNQKYTASQVNEGDFYENVKRFFERSSREERKMKLQHDSIEIYQLKPTNSNHFNEYENENRRLLWHVTLRTNFDSIVEHGLTFDKERRNFDGPEAIYFCDNLKFNCNYARPCDNENIGLFVLCEVALGNCIELKEALYNDKIFPSTDLIRKYDCIIKVGNEEFGDEVKIEIDGARGLCGESKYKHTLEDIQQKKTGDHPNYNNKYMVFSEKIINVKAIVKIKMICPNGSRSFKCFCSYQSPRKRQSQELWMGKDENQNQDINKAKEQNQDINKAKEQNQDINKAKEQNQYQNKDQNLAIKKLKF